MLRSVVRPDAEVTGRGTGTAYAQRRRRAAKRLFYGASVLTTPGYGNEAVQECNHYTLYCEPMKRVAKMLHPSITTDTKQFKIARDICARLATGEKLAEICKTTGYPDASEVISWYLYPNEEIRPGFVDSFNTAQRISWELMAHEIVEIADDDKPAYVTRIIRGKPTKVLDTDKVVRDRLKIDVRKFVLAKRIPETFGDSIKVEHSGQIDLVARLAAGRKRVDSDAEIEAKIDVGGGKLVGEVTGEPVS